MIQTDGVALLYAEDQAPLLFAECTCRYVDQYCKLPPDIADKFYISRITMSFKVRYDSVTLLHLRSFKLKLR